MPFNVPLCCLFLDADYREFLMQNELRRPRGALCYKMADRPHRHHSNHISAVRWTYKVHRTIPMCCDNASSICVRTIKYLSNLSDATRRHLHMLRSENLFDGNIFTHIINTKWNEAGPVACGSLSKCDPKQLLCLHDLWLHLRIRCFCAATGQRNWNDSCWIKKYVNQKKHIVLPRNSDP